MTTPRMFRLSAGLTLVLLLHPLAGRAQQAPAINAPQVIEPQIFQTQIVADACETGGNLAGRAFPRVAHALVS